MEAAVMRKVAWRLVPFLSLGYLINALDRFNVSIAALTMNKALGLSATTYGLGAGAFFFSYVLFQVPANLVLARLGARTWLSLIMATWGICSAATAFVTGERSFIAVRVLLGVAEAGFFPGVAYYLTCWFPARHRGRAMGIFFSCAAVAGVLGAPLSANLLRLDGLFGIQSWQWVFLVEGPPAVVLALFGRSLLCNRPCEATFLNSAERTWLQSTLDAEAEVKSGSGRSLWSVLASRQLVLLTLAYMGINYGLYAMVFFMPLIIKALGVSNTDIGYVLILPNLAGVVGSVVLTRSSDRFGERIWHLAIPLVVGGLGAAAAAMFFGNVYLVVAALSVSLFGAAAGVPLFWNLPTAFLGTTGAAGAVALINSIGTSQGYLAPQITGWLRDYTGGYAAPLLLTGAVLVAAAGLVFASGIAVHLRVPVAKVGEEKVLF
jgi:ACS family tartrate transporter-like MFS transporter